MVLQSLRIGENNIDLKRKLKFVKQPICFRSDICKIFRKKINDRTKIDYGK